MRRGTLAVLVVAVAVVAIVLGGTASRGTVSAVASTAGYHSTCCYQVDIAAYWEGALLGARLAQSLEVLEGPEEPVALGR